jgi:hypothetical protein
MLELRKKEQELIDEILREFNFERCKLTMDYLNWTWATVNGAGVPTIEDLKESAVNRIHSAIEVIRNRKNISYHHPAVCSSGGLQATVFVNKYGHITHIGLEFILADWSSF